MSAESFALFPTPIGACGIAWADRGIVAAQLPEATERETRLRLRRARTNAREEQPPPAVQHAIDSIIALLRGEPVDLSSIVLDMRGVSDFHRRVFEIARAIPVGETRTYGSIATQLGDPTAARAVGQALGRNPFPILVPLPPRARCRWKARRLFRQRWQRDEAAHARHRRCAGAGGVGA